MEDLWDSIGEKLVDLFAGDVICTDKDGVVKFSTFTIAAEISKAVFVAIKTGVRVSLLVDQRRVLVIPFGQKNMIGSVVLAGYEFSEETLSIFVRDVIDDLLKAFDDYQQEDSAPHEILEAFTGINNPVLCAVSAEETSVDMKIRGEIAAHGGKFLKRIESGESFFIFEDFKIQIAPSGTKIGLSKDPRPDVAYHQAVVALHYGSNPSGISDYSKLSPVLLMRDIFEDSAMKLAIIDKLKAYPDLVQTLRIFFENEASPVKTSRIMKVHRNTILNRLNKIRDLTYLDPKIFKDGVILYLILTDLEGNRI